MVKTSLNKRLLAVWLVLTTITVGYLWIDHSAEHSGRETASTAVTISAIVLALIKVRIIMREFMAVRHAPALLRRLTDLWVVIMAAAMLTCYLAGKAIAS